MLARYMMTALLVVLLTVGFTSVHCNSEPIEPGLLERNGIKDPKDVVCVVIRMLEDHGTYRITDRGILNHIYQLINSAEHVSGVDKYFRPNVVTVVCSNGRTLSFGFSLWNPDLTWDYSAPDFVEFVKTEILDKSKYIDKVRLPVFEVSQTAKIVGTDGRQALLPAKTQKVEQVIQLLASEYEPFNWVTKETNWNAITDRCTDSSPGFEVILAKPISFQALVGFTGWEPNGSDALKLMSLTVDKMLVYKNDKLLWLAFHSGKDWLVTGGCSEKYLKGRTPETVYNEILGH